MPRKDAVGEFWDAESCGERYGDEREIIRYKREPEVTQFTDGFSAEGLRPRDRVRIANV